jgi:predicted Zn-dependent protease
VVLAVSVVGLAAANLAVVGEHPSQESVWWKNFRWTRPRIVIHNFVSSTSLAPALRAVNVWNSQTDLSLPGSSSHTDISLFDGDWGPNGWRGLATVWPTSTGEITHCHARLNRYYTSAPSGKTTAWAWEGTYCMELGHCFGLDHDLTAGCMNGGAINAGTANTPSSSNVSAINRRY